jgi:predicted permease
VALDVRVFCFALVCSVLTGLVFGAVPAWFASRADVNDALKENLRGTTGGRMHHRLRSVLIVGEVGFALVLLTGAGLLIGGLERFGQSNPGWRVDGLMFAQLSLKGTNYTRPAQSAIFLRELAQRLAALPGVESVGLCDGLPPVWPFSSGGGFEIEGRPISPGQAVPEVYREAVSLKHFETLGVRLREGRMFTSADTMKSPSVVIINETMARTFWPGESAVGKRIGDIGPERNWREIIGVVNDVQFPATLREPYTRFQSYQPMAQSPFTWISIALRSRLSVGALAVAVRKTVADIDRDQALFQVRAARGLIENGLGRVSLLGRLLGAFAALGLVLAAVGVYGVTSYSVVQRTGEIGIRMALGAQRRDVLWLVLNKGLRLSLLGALIGLAGAWAVSRLLAAAVPTLPSRDPVTFVGVTLALIAAALLACYLPARRATLVNPMEAVRYE